MNWLDGVILVVLVMAIFLGWKTGLIKSALSLGGLIIAIILAGRYYAPLSLRLTFIPQAGLAEAAAFALISIGVMTITSLLAKLLGSVASAVMLGWINHLAGAILGLALGAILSSALLASWVIFLGITEALRHSWLAVTLLDRFPTILALLPSEFEVVRSFFQ